MKDPNGPEQPHLDLHPHPCPWASGLHFSLALFPKYLFEPYCKETSSQFVPWYSWLVDWTSRVDLRPFLSPYFCMMTIGLLTGLVPVTSSPALLCSPCLSPFCLSGGDTALPCAGVTLSSLLEQGRCLSLTVNCCTHPGRVQELTRFGFNHY